jgi:hypothetical protein
MKQYPQNKFLGKKILPVDIVLTPEWWNKHEKISFDRDFFFHPHRRVEDEQKMEKILYDRWGEYGLGLHKNEQRPEIGAVHLAAGYLISEMLGCEVNYSENHPPQVIAANRDDMKINTKDAFHSPAFKDLEKLIDKLKAKYNYLTGDINWGGLLNLAIDLRGDLIMIDFLTNPEEMKRYFIEISEIISKFTTGIKSMTGTSSVSVNRNVRHLDKPIFLHSECSHTMISADDYETYLLPFDIEWSKKRPFGIHYCGADPHRHVKQSAKIPHLDFLDVGWGGDIKMLREYLPNTFLNIRLSPVEIIEQSNDEIRETIVRLVNESGNPYLTGVCCINMDDKVSDDKVTTILETVSEIKDNYLKDL